MPRWGMDWYLRDVCRYVGFVQCQYQCQWSLAWLMRVCVWLCPEAFPLPQAPHHGFYVCSGTSTEGFCSGGCNNGYQDTHGDSHLVWSPGSEQWSGSHPGCELAELERSGAAGVGASILSPFVLSVAASASLIVRFLSYTVGEPLR